MKITPDNNPEMNANQKIENQTAGNKLGLAGSEHLLPDAAQENFASVLDRVTRSHSRTQGQSEDGRSAANSESRDSKKLEEDRTVDDVNPANIERTLAREPVASNEVNTSSRPILHSVDLNNIVTACQVQLNGNGQQVVTLELSRSMLEGLRVKLTSDGAGRITADFLAGTEAIKSLLDGRSQELIEQLRSRGINLAEFRSSVSADANTRNDSQPNQTPTRGERTGEIEAVASVNESESTNAIEDSLAAGATYRA